MPVLERLQVPARLPLAAVLRQPVCLLPSSERALLFPWSGLRACRLRVR